MNIIKIFNGHSFIGNIDVTNKGQYENATKYYSWGFLVCYTIGYQCLYNVVHATHVHVILYIVHVT